MEKCWCFEVVRDVVEEACRRFSPGFALVPDRLDILREYCMEIENIARDTYAEAFGAGVNEETMTVTVTVEAPSITIRSDESSFYELIERSVSFGFRANKEGNTELFFEFPRLWELEEGDG